MTSIFQYTKEETLIDIRNVSVAYGANQVLKNLTAVIPNIKRPDMQQGQIVGLLGPSGIGKTTLFRVLSGIIEPDTGTVLIGRDGRKVAPGDVGVVAQNYPLLDHRTIWSNMLFAARRAGHVGSTAEELSRQYLQDFGLLEHKNKYPSQISGGQRQRVAIAQQLICSEHYLIMDEPFSGLDVVALARVRKMLVDVSTRHEDNTLIVVTHDVTAAVSLCDTIWLMGRDRDAQGQVIPGARIMDTIDLIEMDIAWHDDPLSQPMAPGLIKNIKQRFLSL